MAKARKRPAESWVYVLPGDRALPFEEQSRFTLSPMNHAERAAVRDDLARQQESPDGSKSTQGRMRQQAYVMALGHIVAVENFPAGTPSPWPDDRDARVKYLEMIDDDDVFEIGAEVWARSTLGPAEAAEIKNSSPPELTSSSGGEAGAVSTTVPPAPSTLP